MPRRSGNRPRVPHNGALIVKRPLIAIACAALLLAAGPAGTSSAAQGTGASARAYAIKVIVPGQTGGATREISAPPDAVQFGAGFAYPADGSVASTAAVTASVSAATTEASATAKASSDVSTVSLFGGEITISQVAARASANAASGDAAGDLTGSAVTGLVALGQAVEAAPGLRVSLGDWGYAILLAQGTEPTADGFRGFMIAVDIHLTAAHGGLPANSEILVGYAEATATATAVTEPPVAARPPPARAAPPATGAKPREARPSAPPLVRPVPKLDPQFTRGGFVFPVFGPASFVDTFGAGRAIVGWHHGEDIFAPIGAPVLAVTDGTVFSVGWNSIGGNRLWLRDRAGNEYYYAHLSAFSPLAVNGARVRAGDVLGFVGNTGDAEATPPHLHFEIHPFAMLGRGYDGVVPPYGALLAWRRLEDISFLPGAGWAALAVSNAPRPGAYLLSATDISTASGLDSASLRRALAEPATSAEQALVVLGGRQLDGESPP